jgi:hypothetical protein
LGWVTGEVRLAELLAALSLATDLGMGQPSGHAIQTRISVLARDVLPWRRLGGAAAARDVVVRGAHHSGLRSAGLNRAGAALFALDLLPHGRPR